MVLLGPWRLIPVGDRLLLLECLVVSWFCQALRMNLRARIEGDPAVAVERMSPLGGYRIREGKTTVFYFLWRHELFRSRQVVCLKKMSCKVFS